MTNWWHCSYFSRRGWSGFVKVLCILCHRGIQLIMAYSLARLLSLQQIRVEGGMFLFLCFFTFIPVPLSSLSFSFISSTLSSISFLPFSRRPHKMTHNHWCVIKTPTQSIIIFLENMLWHFMQMVSKGRQFAWSVKSHFPIFKWYFRIFPRKYDLTFHAICLPLETICMKC